MTIPAAITSTASPAAMTTDTQLGTHAIDSPKGVMGPIGVIRIYADDMDALARGLNLPVPPQGAIRLAPVLDLDEALLTRIDARTLLLTPHGGVEIVRRLSTRLTEHGVPLATDQDPTSVYPEAADIHEARALDALARCASPRGVDLLLDQPRRWRDADPECECADPRLDRVIDPPTVVAIGRPNIGKSSLLNALASERVALAADHEGTTRDHIGVLVTLDGLAVQWIDAPGLTGDPGEDDRPEVRALAPALDRAALIVHAIDTRDPDPSLSAPAGVPVLTVALRSDLAPDGGASGLSAVACSARTGDGIADLARAVRAALVPDAALDDPRPWRFWRERGAGR